MVTEERAAFEEALIRVVLEGWGGRAADERARLVDDDTFYEANVAELEELFRAGIAYERERAKEHTDAKA